MKKLLTLLFLSATTLLFTQEFSMDLVKNMKPRNIGPGGMSGRVTTIDVVESNPEIMYVHNCLMTRQLFFYLLITTLNSLMEWTH